MDKDHQTMRKRWDSAPHHLELENGPYHIHIGDQVIPGEPIGIKEVLETVAREK